MAGEYTEAQLVELTERIAAGEQAIKDGDKAVTFADLEVLQRLRDRMVRSLSTTMQRPVRHLAKFSRGDR